MKTFLRYLPFLVLAACARAQTPTATVVGRVVDPSGAAVGEATVRARNVDTNEVRTAHTAAEGDYTLPALTPGNYELSVEKAGFKLLRQEHLVLQVGQTARAPMRRT